MTFDFRNVRCGGFQLRAARWHARGGGSMPLLFLNGIGADIETIEPFARALGRDLITFDPPGIGGSPDPAFPYALPQLAAALPDLLAAFGQDRADIAGFSWGGALAQQFALQFPHQVRRLALIAASHGFTTLPGDPVALLELTDPRALMRSELREAGGQDERTTGHVPQRRPVGFACQLAALTGWSSVPLLPFLACPTLVLSGQRDQIVPAFNARLLETMIPQSTGVSLPDAGHLLMWTHRPAVVGALDDFLGGAGGLRVEG